MESSACSFQLSKMLPNPDIQLGHSAETCLSVSWCFSAEFPLPMSWGTWARPSGPAAEKDREGPGSCGLWIFKVGTILYECLFLRNNQKRHQCVTRDSHLAAEVELFASPRAFIHIMIDRAEMFTVRRSKNRDCYNRTQRKRYLDESYMVFVSDLGAVWTQHPNGMSVLFTIPYPMAPTSHPPALRVNITLRVDMNNIM